MHVGGPAPASPLAEAAAINQSLTTLGRVIDALVDNSLNKKKKVLPPYRADGIALHPRASDVELRSGRVLPSMQLFHVS